MAHRAMVSEAVLDQPIAELAQKIREGAVRAEALTRIALERAEHSGLGGYRVVRSAAALKEAALVDSILDGGRDFGPLMGIPISVKDLFGMPGEETFAGSRTALPPRFARVGPVLGSALRQAAVVTGKTHTVEFAFGGIGINPHWGTPRNPRSPNDHRVPGGSSSGAGPSLFEGSAKVAFGTDTAGSVRIPAAWTGHVGLKTTKGRWSTEGIVPLSPTLDTPGILTRSVDDAIFAFVALDAPVSEFESALARVSQRSVSRLRLSLAPGLFWERCSSGVAEAVQASAGRLEAAGARLFDLALPGASEALDVFSAGGTAAVELHHFLSSELSHWLEDLDEVVRDRVASAATTPAGEYLSRLEKLKLASQKAARAFEEVDAFIVPTVANTPPRVEDLKEIQAYRAANLLALRNTGVVSMLGLCAMSLPCGTDEEGMPVGLQVIGPAGGEYTLLAVARAIERALR